jgi:hypothetical protein
VELAAKIDPVVALLQVRQRLDLDRRMADDVEQLLVAPHVAFERRDVEVADHDGGMGAGFRPPRHPRQEIELLPELHILLAIRNVAACRHVHILEPDAAGQANAEVTRFAIGLPIVALLLDERQLADDRDAVMHALPAQQNMRVAELLEQRPRKGAVHHLRFLQAEYVGLLLDQELLDNRQARSNRIDVPGRDLQGRGHGRDVATAVSAVDVAAPRSAWRDT